MAAAAHPPLAGYAIHRGRPDITLAGSYCRDPSAIVSKAGLQARAAAPRTRHQRHEVRAKKSPSGSFFLSAATTTSTPLPSASKCVRGRVCAGQSRFGNLGASAAPSDYGCLMLHVHVACACCACCMWHAHAHAHAHVHVCGLEFLGGVARRGIPSRQTRSRCMCVG